MLMLDDSYVWSVCTLSFSDSYDRCLSFVMVSTLYLKLLLSEFSRELNLSFSSINALNIYFYVEC